MEHKIIRGKFKAFMESKGHRWVTSSSLIPDDPSVLFTTAGMQQFKSYYTNPSLAPAPNVASIQKCVRTSAIDEVGDASHLTFFEMLGNFSFGGYTKKEAIAYAHEFITKVMGLTIEFVSVFGGEGDVPADKESEEIWKSRDTSLTIKRLGREDNFWGPTGDEGPCGPSTEIYVNGIEIWNVVFNQYFQNKDTSLRLSDTFGIDTGMGLERLAMVSQKVSTVFETDLFRNLTISAKLPNTFDQRAQRIVADHGRSIVFMITNGIRPSNKDHGYVLRRLIRRIVTLEYLWGNIFFGGLVASVFCDYREYYPTLDSRIIDEVYETEKAKFLKTITSGLKELGALPSINASSAFKLYESYGLPFEVIKDIAGDKARDVTREAFDDRFKEHQEKSRSGAQKKFGGHGLLLDTGELKATDEVELKIVTRLHTATHLLQAALRTVLGKGIEQAGSDITAERLRFDFTFERKMTPDEIHNVEQVVNDVIAQDLPVTKVTLPQEEALKTGALHFFKIKYPPQVDVYSVGDFSKEFCGGPHVTHTGEIGKFSITKEESVSAGTRRIRATVS